MAEYSAGRIVKRKQRDGSYQLQARIERYDDSDGEAAPVTLSKSTGVPCDPPSSKDRHGNPTGKGTKQALDILHAWRDALVAADKTQPARPTEISVRDYVKGYFENLDIEDSTLEGYLNMLPRIGHLDMPLSDLEPADVRRWLSWMRKHVSTTTVLKTYDQLRAACDQAMVDGALASNPCRAVKRPKRQQEKEPNPLPVGQLPGLHGKLATIAKSDPDFADICEFALNTGCRRQEIAGLRFRDVDGFADGEFGSHLHIRNVVSRKKGGGWKLRAGTKNGETRDIPLNGTICEILRRRRDAVLPLYDDIAGLHVFAAPMHAETWPALDCITHKWSVFASAHGLIGASDELMTFHDLRHTFATSALLNNVPPLTVSGILGHSSPTVTYNYYAKFIDSENVKAMKFMDGVINPKGEEAA